jgi:transposase-like protein
MRVTAELRIEPAQSWRRLQATKEWFFEDLEALQRQNHQRFLEAMMLQERQWYLNAAPYQRGPARTDQANGFYRRHLTTRLGVLELAVPRTRSGGFHSQVLPRYQRREPVVDHALRQVFLLGISTRQAGRALSALVGEAVSAATVSAVSKVLDERVALWHRRPLADVYRYLILDGVSVRIRLVGRVQRRVALCAYGIDGEGRRELIGFLLAKSESEASWRSLLEDLWRRGLRGAKLELITTDGHAGLAAALAGVWPRVAQQLCWAHKLRNVADKLRRRQRPCLEEAKLIGCAAHRTEAVQRFRLWKTRWQTEAPRAVSCVEEHLEELLAFYDQPSEHWKKIRTTNVIERLFVEVRRRIRTMCAFTTRGSCERILYSVFDRINQYWKHHPLKALTQNN